MDGKSLYSKEDIKRAIIDGHLKIYPFEEKNLTGVGYNISTTNFVFSINKGLLLKVYKEVTKNGYTHYVDIPPNDTVLFFSKELIETDESIGGTFHSKVSRVCQGLGHISTTLDPTWKGQLILAVNNPTNRSIRFELDESSGNILTMLIYGLNSSVSGENIHDNNQGRCDLLLSLLSVNKYHFKKKQRVELEDFIINEFANSLNGYDEFIDLKEKRDKYSKKISNLKELRKRLNNHYYIIMEERYKIGNDGKYQILRDNKERDLVSTCSLFSIMGIDCKEYSEEYKGNELILSKQEILRKIKNILTIIDYELETINHLRRIEWQNMKIEEYAAEASKLEKRNRRIGRIRNIGIFFITATVICSVGWGIYHILLPLGMPDQTIRSFAMTIFTAATTVLSGVIVNRLNKWFDKK